jgi:hypothetical protein
MGELTIARERFEQSLALYRPEMHDSQIAQYGTDLGVAGHCYHALTLWHLGYPDQAVEESYRSITLAQDGAHPFSQAYALFGIVNLFALMQYQRGGEASRLSFLKRPRLES